MKIRNLIFLNFIIFILIFCFFYKTRKETHGTVINDITYINDVTNQVEAALLKNGNINNIEDNFKCKIILEKDQFYQEKVLKSIEMDRVIVDISVRKITFSGKKDFLVQFQDKIFHRFFIAFIVLFFVNNIVLLYIYIYYKRPFDKLSNFAKEIAKGNLDIPLRNRKKNYFGHFTQSFDIMREQLKQAREGERVANIGKKELVASLSHDIKTPVATIKATCEVAKIKEQNIDQRNRIEIIEKKANTIDNLVNNLFNSTMEELNNLKVEPKEELSTTILEILMEYKCMSSSYSYNECNINICGEIPNCLVEIDKLRFNQVIGNIINNSYKYAGTSIDINFKYDKQGLIIIIKDYGNGISSEEMLLVTEKYYRGSNSSGKEGAGLGLYLSKIFMSKMNGGLDCYFRDGFIVELFIKKI